MLQGHSPVSQALLGTFFTWGMTAAGAALVFVFSSGQRRILDGSLGFAAGVMLAASYWSLLAPAVEMATSSGGFGALAFFPVAVGFTLGAAFVYLADLLMPHQGAAEDPQMALALNLDPALMKKSDAEGPRLLFPESELSIRIGRAGLLSEGLAVGVGFGAVEKTASATFESARVDAAAGMKPPTWLRMAPLSPEPWNAGAWHPAVSKLRVNPGRLPDGTEFSHWNWDPEFPGGPRCQPPAARGWILHLESLLVRPAQRHGGASGRGLRCLCRGVGGAPPALCSGLCCRRHGLCDHG
ncbi:zinc transporter ZIP11 isoform X6 [Eubalaena glacialis]|uniref:zinc transporter ZIP11 isoform X6 n=1 Tax=Eubalaena glacialis TaxID=27606 RepID=UPI002A5B0ED8|nr:zinc transporter ZIP11 isoform X6 [Eubalaena glacialis]